MRELETYFLENASLLASISNIVHKYVVRSLRRVKQMSKRNASGDVSKDCGEIVLLEIPRCYSGLCPSTCQR